MPEDSLSEDLPATNKVDLMKNWNPWVCDRNLNLQQVMEFMEDKDHIGRKFHHQYLVFTTSGSTGNPLVAIYDQTTNNVMATLSACRSYTRKEDLVAFYEKGR